MADLYIGTSGWHYDDWIGLFYPPDINGYNELRYHARHFNTVENNSSFYRIAGESTYKTWSRMTPEHYIFSIKLNKAITHDAKLELTDDVKQKITYIITTTQVLNRKLGAVLIQLPASFHYDLPKLQRFLAYFSTAVRAQPHVFDIAIEFRNKHWLNEEVYAVLNTYNIALVAAQSARYPELRRLTADIAYLRLHGPDKLFASPYSTAQLTDWAQYIAASAKTVRRIYVYFNNDFHGYALENARELMRLCMAQPGLKL